MKHSWRNVSVFLEWVHPVGQRDLDKDGWIEQLAFFQDMENVVRQLEVSAGQERYSFRSGYNSV